ncbi:hypothetical protein [Clostridium sp. HBUAS56010]|uniref:hypothetical protein n=1 Tax=Clostridium sp. HBUAS56010 TaxID=2571127 RepID=UPI00163D5AA3|nr:hypothetical protein [Clostridium sp. HBUAS56010]
MEKNNNVTTTLSHPTREEYHRYYAGVISIGDFDTNKPSKYRDWNNYSQEPPVSRYYTY